jgi:kumamolisin
MRKVLVLGLVALGLAALPASAVAGSKSNLGIRQIEAIVELHHPRGLNRFVRQVSDPRSRHYRQYSTVQQLIERYGADEKEQKQVLAYFHRRGVAAHLFATGSLVALWMSRGQAQALMPGGASASAAAAGPRPVPAALRGSVDRIEVLPPVEASADIVLPGTSEQAAARAASSAAAKGKKKGMPYTSLRPHSGVAAGCTEGRKAVISPIEPFTPNQFLKAYGHSALHARGLEGQGQTVAVVEIGGFKASDIATFDKCFGAKPPNLQVNPVLPFHKPLPAEDETTLDLETLSVAAPKLDRIRVYEGSSSPVGVALTSASALGRPGRQPDVVSISLGICEPLFSGQLVIKEAFDNIYAVAAGAGISVLVSAGDQGSSGCRAGPPGEEATELPVLAVAQPSSSPYVTAVGGTNFVLTQQNRVEEELTWNDQPFLAGGTGGGSSILTPRRPWWQQGIHRYGGGGRIVPDVSALADTHPGYAYYCTAQVCREGEAKSPEPIPYKGWTSVGGTSAAAPLTAAGVALVNQYLEGRGQPALGFLNPLLYQLGAEAKERAGVFFDVRKGNNDLGRLLLPEVGGGKPLGCCSARSGYDWATGWGSLKFVGFARAAQRAGAGTAGPIR